jgi:hypothetical protein
MPWMSGAGAIANASAQKNRDFLRTVRIRWPAKQSEPSRLQKDAVRGFPEHPGAVCQHSCETAFQAVSGQKFRCNGIIAAALKQVITALAGEYCLRVLRLCDARPHIIDRQTQRNHCR